MGSWDYKNFDYIDLLGRTRPLMKDYEFHYQPTGAIIGMIIQKDLGKNDQYSIYLDQPSFGQYSFSRLPNHEVYRLGKNSNITKHMKNTWLILQWHSEQIQLWRNKTCVM